MLPGYIRPPDTSYSFSISNTGEGKGSDVFFKLLLEGVASTCVFQFDQFHIWM